MIRANAAEPSTLKPNPLQRWWAGLIRSLAPAPPLGVAPASGMLPAGHYSADICIVTNAAFSGGNAASTVTEFLAFQRAGLQVLMVHCPIRSSRAKSHWLAERYLPHQRSIIPADLAQAIRCKTLIVRGPRMIMAKPFARLAPRVETQRALFVINNSASNEDGTHLFDWSELNSRVVQIDWPQSSIFPISPIIRAEAVRALSKQASHRLAPGDWPPAFDVDAYSYAPRGRLTPPIVIGRHGRDHPGKWLEDAQDLRSAYPDAPERRVRVMGGAATVERRLGKLPSNWEVEPFSTAGVPKFLAGLDVFVYFPAQSRDEAFGRTIVEALLSGLPTILPPRFEANFGDLSLYCEPGQVAGVIERLAADDAGRLAFLEACRSEAARRFGTDNLIRRLQTPAPFPEHRPQLDTPLNQFRRRVMAV